MTPESGGSVPDPLGRDRLAAGAASYKPPVYGVKPPAKPLYLQRRFQALLVVAALLVSFVVQGALRGGEDSPEAAATEVIGLFIASDYGQMRSKLCREDRAQVGRTDLETAGQSAGALVRTLDRVTITGTTDVTLQGSSAELQAKQVRGAVSGKLGAPGTTFAVVTVKETGGWRVCLSPGGYSLGALDLDVPIGGELEQP